MKLKITEVSYSFSQKFQVVQYEPIEIFYSIKAEVEPDADIMEAYDTIAHIVNERAAADRLKWSDPQKAARALSNMGKTELARQVLKKKNEVPFN